MTLPKGWSITCTDCQTKIQDYSFCHNCGKQTWKGKVREEQKKAAEREDKQRWPTSRWRRYKYAGIISLIVGLPLIVGYLLHIISLKFFFPYFMLITAAAILVAQDMKNKNKTKRTGLYLLILGLAVSVPLIIGNLLNKILPQFFFPYFMLITAAAILAAPIRFSFNRWDPPKEITPIITIDATVIVGTLFFLNLQNLKPEILPLIRDLTALTIIPFAFSAILVIVWGRHFSGKNLLQQLRV